MTAAVGKRFARTLVRVDFPEEEGPDIAMMMRLLGLVLDGDGGGGDGGGGDGDGGGADEG